LLYLLLEEVMRARSIGPLLCLLCACYESVPVELSRVTPGSKVRVSLTDAGADSLARYLGPGVLTIDGKLISTTDTGVSLSVTSVAMRSGQDQFWKGETVVIPRSSLGSVLARRINKPRSLIVVAAIVVAATTLKLSGVGGQNNGNGRGTGGGGGAQ
jgi:hypothetical protein